MLDRTRVLQTPSLAGTMRVLSGPIQGPARRPSSRPPAGQYRCTSLGPVLPLARIHSPNQHLGQALRHGVPPTHLQDWRQGPVPDGKEPAADTEGPVAGTPHRHTGGLPIFVTHPARSWLRAKFIVLEFVRNHRLLPFRTPLGTQSLGTWALKARGEPAPVSVWGHHSPGCRPCCSFLLLG